jgi:hypothetical protein
MGLERPAQPHKTITRRTIVYNQYYKRIKLASLRSAFAQSAMLPIRPNGGLEELTRCNTVAHSIKLMQWFLLNDPSSRLNTVP